MCPCLEQYSPLKPESQNQSGHPQRARHLGHSSWTSGAWGLVVAGWQAGVGWSWQSSLGLQGEQANRLLQRSPSSCLPRTPPPLPMPDRKGLSPPSPVGTGVLGAIWFRATPWAGAEMGLGDSPETGSNFAPTSAWGLKKQESTQCQVWDEHP